MLSIICIPRHLKEPKKRQKEKEKEFTVKTIKTNQLRNKIKEDTITDL